MCARVLLLLLASAACAHSPAPPPVPPAPALVVLRSACPLRDRGLFSQRRLLAYAKDVGQLTALPRPLRLLSYEETCEERWLATITRKALETLAAGGSVWWSGREGGGACDALAGATRMLRRPQPAACATPDARAAAVARLAVRLRWRRVLLPPPAALGATCARALRSIESALATLGVTVRRANDSRELISHPHASLVCASGISAIIKEYADFGILLILHVEEEETSEKRILTNDEVFEELLGKSLLYVDNESTLSTPTSFASRDVNVPDAETFRQSSVAAPLRGDHAPDVYASPVGLWIKKTSVEQQKLTPESLNNIQNSTNSPKTRLQRFVRKRRKAINWVKRSFDGLQSLLLKLEVSVRSRSLLLSSEIQEFTSKTLDVNDVYREALETVQRYAYAERTGTETVRKAFFLYECTKVREEYSWDRVATFSTVSTRNIANAGEWVTVVDTANTTVSFSRWRRGGTEEGEGSAGAVVGIASALCAVTALVLAAGGAALLQTARRRSARRGPRADVLLSAADFTFPADEGRRVGEGMETMLSWLQQLHEFTGPEPDLLPPRAPSAPSSTCSVSRLTLDTRVRYKGEPVLVRYLPAAALEPRRKATDVLLVMQSLRHENLNPFIGCLPEARPALVWEVCGRGSLEDVLVADDIRLDWPFRLSLLTDLVRGMRYLHASPLRVHGRLSSRACLVDSRWVLRLADYGAPAFTRALGLAQPTRDARDLLWTAPELLREQRAGGGGGGGASGGDAGTQPGDVFSFAIVMQEVIVRGEPYCMLPYTPEEILEKLCRPPPLIRPSVSMGAAPPDAVSVMRQCWSEAPDLRPDFNRLHDIFRHLHRGRKINIVDSMFEMLEKYSNNLEELIKERTEQLDMEKKKTEQLLNRMLPRSVAERLMLGMRVEPEEFEEVSIYFSDIVGFTAIAARSTPVQVVDLLNDLYTTFDAAIEQYRVYKVETIGDAYMVVGGLPLRTRDHAESVATMALHLLHLAGRFRVRHLPAAPLHLRIGLHTGPCCAAVVGLTMPRYCLFGDTVNTASRMESTGAAWRIQVSAATAERLAAAGGYRLRSRGLTQVKGKGAMHTYWLLGKDGFDKPLPTPPPLQSEEVLFETDGENELEHEPSSPPAAHSPAPPVERQRSDPSPTSDKFAWQRSGAVSADSSPPPRAPPPARYRYLRSSVSTLGGFGDTPTNSESWGSGGPRSLRRQWSLEHGDALAAAVAAGTEPAPCPPGPHGPAGTPGPPEPPEPLALRAAPMRAAPPRYRTRSDALDHLRPP